MLHFNLYNIPKHASQIMISTAITTINRVNGELDFSEHALSQAKLRINKEVQSYKFLQLKNAHCLLCAAARMALVKYRKQTFWTH